MIEYYLTPFAAPSDEQASAGIADVVNSDKMSAISQAPHHFELHLLGEMDETGNLHPKRELVCDCSTLIRARRQSPQPASGKAENSADESYAGTLRS